MHSNEHHVLPHIPTETTEGTYKSRSFIYFTKQIMQNKENKMKRNSFVFSVFLFPFSFFSREASKNTHFILRPVVWKIKFLVQIFFYASWTVIYVVKFVPLDGVANSGKNKT
jgi:predicted membrane protein